MFNTDLFKLINNINDDTYFVGDTHFFHKNILRHEPIRVEMMKKDGFEDMNEWLIHKWNQKVKPTDTVFHLGDVAYKTVKHLKGRLNGKLVLILGNHDHGTEEEFKLVFDHVIYGSFLHFNNKLYVAESNDNLFSTITMGYKGKTILISHYPATNLEKKWYINKDTDKPKEDRTHKEIKNDNMVERISHIMDIADENNIEFNLHGHTHSKILKDDTLTYKLINCSIENLDFAPKKLGEIMKDHI